MPYIVSGTVQINGRNAPNGSAVQVWAFDGSGGASLISTTMIVANGGFSTTVPDNTHEYRAIYDDGSHRGISVLAAPTGTAPGKLIVIVGDSNCVGQGDTDHVDRGPNLLAAFASVQYKTHYATTFGDPVAYTDFGPGNLAPYHAGGAPGMGYELTLGREMFATGSCTYLAKLGINGTTADDYKPTGTHPVSGGNLSSQLITFLTAMVAASGQPLGAVVLSLGTNDASTVPLSVAYQANITAIIAAIRAAFGADVVIAIPKLNNSATNTEKATVRAAQVAYVAGDSKSVLIENDDITLTDGFHYTSDGYASMGQRIAYALSDKLGYARPVNAGLAPEFAGSDIAVYGAGALSPPAWSGQVDSDLEIMVMTTGLLLATIAIATAQGFTLVTSVNSDFSGLREQFAVFSRPVVAGSLVNGRMPAPLTTDNNNLNAALIFTVRGAAGVLPVIEASQTAANNTDGTTMAMTGVTTLGANRLVLCISAGYVGGANTNSMANGGLASFAKQRDSLLNIGSDFQMLTVYSGVQAAAGATGTTTLTSTGAAIHTGVTLAIKAA